MSGPATRLQRVALDAEARMSTAARQALDEYLTTVRRAVLQHDTNRVGTALDNAATRTPLVPGGLAAATDPAPLGTPPRVTELPPNLDAWPPVSVWTAAVNTWLVPVAQHVFGLAFSSQTGHLAPEQTHLVDMGRHVTRFLADTTSRLTGAAWPNDVYDRVRGLVAQANDETWTAPELRERIRQALRLDRWTSRADTIARTESLAAVNAGAHAAGVERIDVLGQALRKRWLATDDSRTRPAHAELDGTTLDRDDRFDVAGEALLYPHDPHSSAANAVNCRCLVLWLDPDEEAEYARVDESLVPAEPENADTPEESMTQNNTPVAGDALAAAAVTTPPADTVSAVPEPTADPTTTATSTASTDATALTAAAASGSTSLPLDEADTEWDGAAARREIKQWASKPDGTIDFAKYRQGFFYEGDPGDDGHREGDYKLPFARVVDGKLVAIPAGIFAAAAAIQGSQGGVDLPSDKVDAVKTRVAGYYRKLNRTPPWDGDKGKGDAEKPKAKTVAASVTVTEPAVPVLQLAAAAGAASPSWAERIAGAVPAAPEYDAFFQPPGKRGTKMGITDETKGWVAGYIADWDARHRVHDVPPPRDPYGGAYPQFHRHSTRVADGRVVKTGPVATNGHGDTTTVDLWKVVAHYDDPRYVAANVRVQETPHGIWASGSLRPGVEPWQVAMLDAYSQSGHWMPGPDGYAQELVASCCVTVEAFALPNPRAGRAMAMAASVGMTAPRLEVVEHEHAGPQLDGKPMTLVAAGVLLPPVPGLPVIDGAEVYRQFKAAQEADLAVAAARRRVLGGRVLAAAARIGLEVPR